MIENKDTGYPSMLYFAYGSNMDPQQMEKRCPGFLFIGSGYISDMKMVFPAQSKRWNCGVAGLSAEKDHLLWGVIYEINEHHLHTLDEIEGIQENRTKKEYVEVHLKNTTMKCLVYNPIPEGSFSPSKNYLDTILSGARFWHLPTIYIKTLEQINTHTK